MGSPLIPLMGRMADIQTPNEMRQGALQNQNLALMAQQRQMELEQQRQLFQQQQADSKTFQQAMLQTGGDIPKALGSVSGKVSPQFQMTVTKAIAEQADKLSSIKAREFEQEKYKHKQLGDLLAQAVSAGQESPEKLQATWPTVAQAAKQLGLNLDPNAAPSQEQLQAYGALYGAQDSIFKMADEKRKQTEEIRKQAEEKRKAAIFPLQQTELGQKVTGAVPMTEYQKAQIDAQNKNVTDPELAFRAAKGDEQARKAIEIRKGMMAAGKTSLSIAQPGEGLDIMAERALAGGTVPSRNPTYFADVMNRAGQLARERGLTAQAAVMEGNAAQAGKLALTAVTKQYETLKPFAEMAERNADLLEKASRDVSDLGSSFLNTPLREVQMRFMGNKKVAAFHAALLPVQADFARILNSPTGSGVLSDTARLEMQKAISPGATVGQIKSALDIFRADAMNRKRAYEDEISNLKKHTVVGGPASSSVAPPSGPVVKTWNEKTQKFE